MQKVTHLLNSGRLGNQLFQIASTIGIAKKNNRVPMFTRWEYSDFIKGELIEALHITPTAVHHEDYFHYSEPNLPDSETVELKGYYQSKLYWKGYEKEIKELFSPNKKTLDKLKHKYSVLLGKYNTCSIHIRRGDYVGNTFYANLFPTYYYDAIEYMELNSLVKIDKYLIVSDDIEWCKTNFLMPYSEKFVFIEGNSDIEDLYLMSMCINNIIANSSFSFWSAYLNKNENKIVVAPEKWFGDGTALNTKDLYLKQWVKK